MNQKNNKLTYTSSGVDYVSLDAVKKMAQEAGRQTTSVLQSPFTELTASRGESAYVLETPGGYMAFVQEGLGTKNLVADEMRKITGKTYYGAIAQDTVAMIINDLITVGAKPTTILAYWAVGDGKWFEDKQRSQDLIAGWKSACIEAGAVWGGGETPALKGIISTDTIDLGGSAYGTIAPNCLVMGDSLQIGDAIVLFESTGIHANGLTLARTIADQLSDGYATTLSDGQMYGEALLQPTRIYSKVVQDVLDAGVDIHYMANITGHGWRKIMRYTKPFTYKIETVQEISPLFQFIKVKSGLPDSEMYATFNMGAGFALFVPAEHAEQIISRAQKHQIKAWIGGRVENGEKQVIIEPLGITYTSEDLDIR